MRQTIGDFLIRRLQEVGVRHIFGVPGDYNLEFMQQLEVRGEPAWVGNCNELNASYATDAYARLNGIGALVVTHGVGALSAINGIAGAYSEHVPVILISGSLPLRAVQRGDLMHHTLADREKGNFCRMFAEVTGAQARLTPENAVVEIDRLILTAWRNKLPVYLELPSDISYLEIAVPEAPLALEMMPSEWESLSTCTEMILRRLRSAKSPAFLLDLDAIRFGVAGQIMVLAERFHIKVATLNCAKGAVAESSSQYIGTYAGIGSSRATREAIEGSDCLLTVGYRRVESTSGFFTAKLPASAIHLNSHHVDTAEMTYQGVYLAELLQTVVDSSSGNPTTKPPARPPTKSTFVPSAEPLSQDAYWKAIQNFLQPGDVIIAEDGTSSAGFGRLTLPDDCIYVTGAFVWCSIGYATAALLGASLASPGRRHILLTGEGSLQMTVQEISTVMRHDLKPWIFVNQNQGYTVERAVLGKDAKFNDVATWRYSELPHVFSRDKKAETYVVTTSSELQKVLDAPHSGMVFVECVMNKFDAPIDLIIGGHAIAETDYGARGPQAAPNAQIALPTKPAERTVERPPR
ncbi:Pyruvate decarboxylase [Labilithrix luteola]|uniref:Pyruvate decarboxylase n=1 Tax=Labilithrix luteola TaxID=1391654 RepID=A0A0K1PZ22_9BACT|nr:thiamine pyrophosphate-binding protein [Labilithrix luteola]AKU98732.1 Pyruvate decarboxylase [Labilithrix luteola]